MPPPNAEPQATVAAAPDDLVEAGVYASPSEGADHGLVVLALGWPYWLMPHDGVFRLLVEPQALPLVRDQLAAFDRESAHWPPPPIVDHAPRRKAEFLTPLLWALVVLGVFRAQGDWPALTGAGALDPAAVFDRGEWWRAFTALFLHADAGHVVSNGLGGILVFSAVLTTLGRRRGWLLLIVASIVGNLAVAALNYPGPYRSIGASTALFAGIGLLTGRALRLVRLAGAPHGWRALIVPLGAGLTVLGLYGAGGVRVDVMAHAAGFLAGLVLGFLVTLRRP